MSEEWLDDKGDRDERTQGRVIIGRMLGRCWREGDCYDWRKYLWVVEVKIGLNSCYNFVVSNSTMPPLSSLEILK